jgi:hypothetical protein
MSRRGHVIARLHEAHQRAIDGRHARGCGKAILGALDCGHALFEHCDCGIAVAGVDIFVWSCLDEACFGILGGLIDEALSEEDRFADLAPLAAFRSTVDQFGPCFPSLAHVILHARAMPTKKPVAVKQTGCSEALTF